MYTCKLVYCMQHICTSLCMHMCIYIYTHTVSLHVRIKSNKVPTAGRKLLVNFPLCLVGDLTSRDAHVSCRAVVMSCNGL